MTNNKETISLIVSALNEEGNLPILIDKSVDILPKYFADYEIIVIDDGSKDRTAEVVGAYVRKGQKVKLIRHPANLGVGASIRDAIAVMQFGWAFQIPGDNQFDVGEVEKFVPALASADVVQGWRVNLDYTLRRKFVTWVYRTLLRVLFGLNLKDPTWVKMIRRNVAQSVSITTNGFFGEIEILIKAKRKGARFSQVGVHIQDRLHGTSSATSLYRVLKTFFELIRFRFSLSD